MERIMKSTSSAGVVQLRFETVRNLTSSDEKNSGTRTYFANVPFTEVLKLDTVENLRRYIPELRPSKRNKVHQSIARTIANSPDQFIVLNSGFTVSASDCTINEEKKTLRIVNGSLINGAQSQGELRRYLDRCEQADEEPNDFHVRVEIIVMTDPDFVAEVAIARNTATKVSELAQAGKRAKFDDLERGFQKLFPGAQLRKSDTDPADTIDTERVIQLCAALMPAELVGEEKFISSKLKAYKNKAQCRIEFERAHDIAIGEPSDEEVSEEERQWQAEKYAFYIDIAPFAWKAYEDYRTHQAWRGKRLRKDTKAVKRKPNQELIIADGLIFPMISALSLFVRQIAGHWRLVKPPVFRDEMLIDAAVEQFREGCGSNPVLMGRTPGAYQSLMLVPRMSLMMNAAA
jgi:hypothetical protein